MYDSTNDARLAAEKKAEVISEYFKGPGIVPNIIGLGISLLATLASIAVDKVTQAKSAGQPGLHDLIAATLSDALLIDLKAADIPIGQGAAGQAAVNSALGGKFLDALKTFMGASGTVNGDSAEKAAAAIVGLGMQMSVNTGFLAILGGAVPFLNMDELKEIGEMLEKSLGLGRLTRAFLMPYVQNLVQKPLTHKLAAQYRQDILGTHELIKALFRNGPLSSKAHDLLTQHGLPDEQIAELIDQQRPHLSVGELESLVYNGDLDQASATEHIAAAGIPKATSDLMFASLTAQRLSRIREAGISQVVSEVRRGFLSMADLETAFRTFAIPLLEQDLWRKRAQIGEQSPHRHISHGDMLFLYEAGQVTLDEVGTWAQSLGFSEEDIQRLQILFTLKAAVSHNGKSGGSAAKAVHTHNEHVAFVTDEISGLFSRKPTAAELTYWVTKLDQGDRTKGDFKAEIKGLDPGGPAIPPIVDQTP